MPAVLFRLERGEGDPEQVNLAAHHAQAVVDALHAADGVIEPFFVRLEQLLPRSGESVRRLFADRQPPASWDELVAAKERLVAGLAAVMRPAEAVREILQEMAAGEVADETDFVRQLTATVEWLRDLIRDIEAVLALSDPNTVYWVERTDRRGVEAWAAPILVGPKLLDAVYKAKRTVIFTSATLTVARSTLFLKRRLGLTALEPERLVEMDAGTPFDYPEQCRVLVPLFLPEPNDREFAGQLAVLLAEVFRRTEGRGLALFTSYDMLRRATETLEGELAGEPIQVLAQGQSGSREQITDVFKRDVASVLMGTHSFWEGVDLVGETLSCLVVAKLPFAVFTDPVHQARSEQVESEGRDAFLGYSVPGAVIRLRQGFGRLIRHKTDRGIVILADRRVWTRRYGRWFLKSLPAPTEPFRDRDAFLDAVQEFLADAGGTREEASV
jgi:Rad3-related DNA helicase